MPFSVVPKTDCPHVSNDFDESITDKISGVKIIIAFLIPK
jgi:hypothetical protein